MGFCNLRSLFIVLNIEKYFWLMNVENCYLDED